MKHMEAKGKSQEGWRQRGNKQKEQTGGGGGGEWAGTKRKKIVSLEYDQRPTFIFRNRNRS